MAETEYFENEDGVIELDTLDVIGVPDTSTVSTDTSDTTNSEGGGHTFSGPAPEPDYRVSLRSALDPSEYITFVATPDLVETRNVNYKTVEPVHAPGGLYAFAHTSARTFQLSSVKLISRTKSEAHDNLVRLWRLRGWCMPEFGGLSVDQLGYDFGSVSDAGLGSDLLSDIGFTTESSGVSIVDDLTGAVSTATNAIVDPITNTVQTVSDEISSLSNAISATISSATSVFDSGDSTSGVSGSGNATGDSSATSSLGGSGTGNMRGAPPQVLLLSAYSRESSAGQNMNTKPNSVAEHINRVPVVIQNLTIPYPSDVDYIESTEGVPVPTIMSIDISLVEAHAPAEYETFSLSQFKQGLLAEF